jgi:hypothetical protein
MFSVTGQFSPPFKFEVSTLTLRCTVTRVNILKAEDRLVQVRARDADQRPFRVVSRNHGKTNGNLKKMSSISCLFKNATSNSEYIASND